MKRLTFGLTSLRKKPGESTENLTVMWGDEVAGSAGVCAHVHSTCYFSSLLYCVPFSTIPLSFFWSPGQNIINRITPVLLDQILPLNSRLCSCSSFGLRGEKRPHNHPWITTFYWLEVKFGGGLLRESELKNRRIDFVGILLRLVQIHLNKSLMHHI